MDIFESLENLPVSESCFEDIIGLVEEYINETKAETWVKAAEKSIPGRLAKVKEGPYEPYTEFYKGKATKKEKPSTHDQTNLVRLRRAQDIVNDFKDTASKNKDLKANDIVKDAERNIDKLGVDDAAADIYGYDDYDEETGETSASKLRKGELALSANKKKYQAHRDNPEGGYATYNSPFYDERKGAYNRGLGDEADDVTRPAKGEKK